MGRPRDTDVTLFVPATPVTKHPCLTWPPALPVNIIRASVTLCCCFQRTLGHLCVPDTPNRCYLYLVWFTSLYKVQQINDFSLAFRKTWLPLQLEFGKTRDRRLSSRLNWILPSSVLWRGVRWFGPEKLERRVVPNVSFKITRRAITLKTEEFRLVRFCSQPGSWNVSFYLLSRLFVCHTQLQPASVETAITERAILCLQGTRSPSNYFALPIHRIHPHNCSVYGVTDTLQLHTATFTKPIFVD
jgi:hypothetical protein